MAVDLAAEPVVPYRALLGEGPVWDPYSQSLVWLDYRRQEVHTYKPDTGVNRAVSVEPTPVSALGVREKGGWICAAGRGFAFFEMADGSIQWLKNVPAGDRMNDGACDPTGRFLAGTMTFDRRPEAALYSLDSDLTVRELLAPVTVSNGLDWSPDGTTLFFVDTPTRHVVGFRYNLGNGTLGEVRYAIDLRQEAGNPDGLTVDAEGMIWVAMFRGAKIIRYSPDGRRLGSVAVPASNVTSCSFGGTALRDLYITTAARGLTEGELADQPHAGSLFCVETDTRGQPARTFGG